MKKILIALACLFIVGVAVTANEDNGPGGEAVEVTVTETVVPETAAPETTVAITTPEYDQKATVVDLVKQVYRRPIYVSDTEIWDAVLGVCAVYDGGGSTYDLMLIMKDSSDGNADIGDLMAAVIVAAVNEICPEYLAELEAAVN